MITLRFKYVLGVTDAQADWGWQKATSIAAGDLVIVQLNSNNNFYLTNETMSNNTGLVLENTGINDATIWTVVGDWNYIGVLEIPSLNLVLPVIDQWSYDALLVSPARYTGSAYLDNMVIAAHNYTSHFGRLRELSLEDEIRFVDVDGNIFYYKVQELQILPPTAVDEMVQADGWDLTMFTCTWGGQSRVTVRCARVLQPNP